MSWQVGVMARMVGIRRAFLPEGLPGLGGPDRRSGPRRQGPSTPLAPRPARPVYAELAHRRRRAQIAARRLLASMDAC